MEFAAYMNLLGAREKLLQKPNTSKQHAFALVIAWKSS
jgi:hypothetical protein